MDHGDTSRNGSQALEHDRTETFNIELFRKLGELGLPGVTVPEEFGGTGMDATASVIVHEELAVRVGSALLCVHRMDWF